MIPTFKTKKLTALGFYIAVPFQNFTFITSRKLLLC